jgi:hypothetical protein
LPVTLESHDFRVHDDDDDDPILLDVNGVPVDTWRENFPYDERMGRDEYEEQKRLLQIELLKAAEVEPGARVPAHHRVRGP